MASFNSTTSLDLVGFCDADWVADLDDKRSTSGYCVCFGQNLVSWASKKQHTVSRSNSEAEYRSLAHLTAEMIWLQSLLTELQCSPSTTPLVWCDNLSTVLMAANLIQHARTKHIELDQFFVRERVANKQLIVKHVASSDQIVDILTKPLTASRFQLLRHKLRVSLLSPLSLWENVRISQFSDIFDCEFVICTPDTNYFVQLILNNIVYTYPVFY